MESKKQKVVKTKNGRILIPSKCTLCDSEKIMICERARS